MPDFVTTKVGDLSGAVSLMPICGDKDPSALADFWEEGFVRGSYVCGDVLPIDAISDAASTEFFDDLGAVPVFVKVES
jgi:hypothetical protein